MCLDTFPQEYISLEEIQKCIADSQNESHHLAYLFASHNSHGINHCTLTRGNIISSYNEIRKYDQDWLQKTKGRILDYKDMSNCVSALSEMCCYGYLLSAFGHERVRPIPASTRKTTPDFKVCNNEECVYIEVNAMQMNGEERNILDAFHSNNPILDANKTLSIREHVIIPYGRRNTSCITENAIHKICQTKSSENQFDAEHPSVLWIDFQDSYISMITESKSYNSCPVYTNSNMLWSNELWYAFYGEKNYPIYEHHVPFRVKLSLPSMKHCGRFSEDNKSKVDAAVLVFPNSTIIYENPYSQKKIPQWFVKRAFNFRRFKYHGSRIDYPAGMLIKQLELDKMIIHAFLQ